ncbi:MAG: AroM family protein [Firmicutes bacterium]|nr:AroM family protein [Bacillota bacterium]
MKIGAITVGQAPRVDVTCDITDIFPEDLQLLEKGGLDGLSREDIEAFAPEEGDYVLVSRLTDGSSVTFAEKHIIGRLQQAIDELQRQGVRLIMIFCTGHFPESLHADVPMIFPDKLLHGVVPAIAGDADLITVTPSPLQVSQNESKWAPYVKSVKCFAGSPYGGIEGLRPVAEQIAAWGRGDLIVLDCIGFTKEMKQMFSQITGKPVILPRTLLARVVCEMISR